MKTIPTIYVFKQKLEKTRIVRGSDYSPASELFARVRQTMTGNNPKLDLVNVDAHNKIGQILAICSQGILTSIKGQNSVKSLVRFCQFFLKILSGNYILMSIKGRYSV